VLDGLAEQVKGPIGLGPIYEDLGERLRKGILDFGSFDLAQDRFWILDWVTRHWSLVIGHSLFALSSLLSSLTP
jgi:hypothetical protein